MLIRSLANKFFAALLTLLLVVPAARALPAPQQSVSNSSRIEESQPAQPRQQLVALPDAPTPQEVAQNAQQNTQQSSSGQQQNSTTSPVGTAAAPAEQPVGVAGSKPAGAVIAPATQRRIPTFLISVALIAGAGIAIGTVAALSHASPSQPH
jgi:hypothetical protein